MLTTAARLTVPAIADWCFVDVVEEAEGSVSRFAVAHSDPGDEALARALQRTYRLDPGRAHGTGLQNGRPRVDRRTRQRRARGHSRRRPRVPRSPAGYGIELIHVRPAPPRGPHFGRDGFDLRPECRYGAEDVALAEGVAHCAALALDNARHHASEVELVRELVRRASGEERVISLPRKEAPQITPRQREVLEMLSSGHSTREISRELYLSEATVRNHIRGLLQAFGAHSQLEVLAKARQSGVLR